VKWWSEMGREKEVIMWGFVRRMGENYPRPAFGRSVKM